MTPTPQCPECAPLPWQRSKIFPNSVYDAMGRIIFSTEDIQVAAFIVAAANATMEKETHHE